MGCSTPVTLEGKIVDAYTNQPIASAHVSINDGALVKTDAQGNYVITVRENHATLRVHAPDYDTLQVTLGEVRGSSPERRQIAHLALRPHRLEGEVTDRYTGQPIADVHIQAQAIDAAQTPIPGHPILTATTSSTGTYVLVGIPEHVRLTLTAEGYEPLQTTCHRTTQASFQLRPNVLRGFVTDKFSGAPVAGATVSLNAGVDRTDLGDATTHVSTTTTLRGSYLLTNVPEPPLWLEVRAEGYAPLTQEVSQTGKLNLALRPDVVTGFLVDAESGQPVSFATIIATTSLTGTAVAFERIDQSPDGRFRLRGIPEHGYIHVLAPGYRKATLPIGSEPIATRIELQPFAAKALYVKTSTVAYRPEKVQMFFDIIDRTELNAMVIDLKSDDIADLGLIYYASEVPIIKELGTSKDLMDIRGLLAEAKRRNIYTIARIHIFAHDNLLAETKPEWAAKDARGCTPGPNRPCNGDIFYADWDIAWLDPWNREVWDYNIQLAVEAAQLGFDEIQFDYIRFPSDATHIDALRLSRPTDYLNDPESMYENIVAFMREAQQAIHRAGAFFSVDIFGYAVWGPQALIGQDASRMAPYADYICPMVYPSHFVIGELGFANPAAHPYEIVHQSLKNGYQMVHDKRARMRPWLQDFTLIWVPDHLIVRYGVPEVRAQIDATEALTYTAGWSLWSADNEYTYQALKVE